ncbi:MAG: FAD-dependent oxidoreductase [Candidatus Njordarchaeia archaeon]
MREIVANYLIIGGGIAGLYIGKYLSEKGESDVVLVESEKFLGGKMGLVDLNFARKHKLFVREQKNINVLKELFSPAVMKQKFELLLTTTVFSIGQNGAFALSKEHGLIKFKAKKYIIATGSRDATRWELGIVGRDRIGAYASETLLRFLKDGFSLGQKYVIYGENEMAKYIYLYLEELFGGKINLTLVGEEILSDANLKYLRGRIVEIDGDKRVKSVIIENDGKRKRIDCDALILSKKRIPRTELLDESKIQYNLGKHETSIHNIFLCGEVMKQYHYMDEMMEDCEKLGEKLLEGV